MTVPPPGLPCPLASGWVWPMGIKGQERSEVKVSLTHTFSVSLLFLVSFMAPALHYLNTTLDPSDLREMMAPCYC